MKTFTDIADIEHRFELEFCLAPSAYAMAFPQEELLWTEQHAKHVAMFHALFSTRKGRKALKEDINVILPSMFSSRGNYLRWFDSREFSKKEWRFLIRNIRAIKTKWFKKDRNDIFS